MIWGIRFTEIEDHLLVLGFVRIRLVQDNVLYRRGDDIFTIRSPNVFGSLPENLVNDAFHNAELPLADWKVGWID